MRRGLPWVLAGALVLGTARPGLPQQPRPCPAATLGSPTPLVIRGQAKTEEAPAQSNQVQPGSLEQRIYPINLATALQLANARPLDVAIAARQVEVAAAALDRARYAWLPTVLAGGDYFRHEGPQQNSGGDLQSSSRQSALAGLGVNATFAVTDAIFGPLAARQELRAREARAQATANDITLSVAEAYFNLQQARGEYAGALRQVKEGTELVRRTDQLAKAWVPTAEATRARVELARRRQAAAAARERWQTGSAELSRLLRLEPSVLVDPVEPANLTVPLIDSALPVDDLIAIALTSRPELAANQALVQATLQRLRQEKLRPLIPSVLIRGASTPVTGTFSFGAFGGGPNSRLGDFNARLDLDAQLLWEFQNLGVGNRARVRERQGEHEVALLELFRTQDRIASEVATEYARLQSAAERLRDAEPALRDALDSLQKNMEGLRQPRGIGEGLVLVNRPQEVVAALQALALATSDYYVAVGDYNRAQFRLYRALGQPAQSLAAIMPCAEPPRK
jgi:outer membrane protein TolC